MKGSFGVSRLVPIAVTVMLLAVGGSVLFAASNTIPGIRDNEVTDSVVGRQFLTQEVEIFLPDRPSDVVGTYEYFRVPGSLVLAFQAQQGVDDPSWMENPPESAIVLSWSSTGVAFQAPHPPPDFDATLRGDTYLIILVPGEGRKITAVVSAGALAGLRAGATDTVREPLTLPRTN